MQIAAVSLAVLLCLGTTADAVRFAVNGPTLTVTVRDPRQSPSTVTSDNALETLPPPWFDLAALRPNIRCGIQSLEPPLPNWLPSLKSIRAGIGYSYTDLQRLPSWVEATGKFAITPSSELQVQPSYQVKSKKANLMLQVSRGAAYLFARLSSREKYLVEALRGSMLFNTPIASVSSIRVTPSVDLVQRDAACIVEAVTGGAGRTKAVLHLERQNPTLAVVYALDDRNIIAPEINLYNAKIVYQWNSNLGSGSSVRTKVDPTSAIEVTWTDQSVQGGSWVTEVRLPLEGTSINGLAADVKVRRQFSF